MAGAQPSADRVEAMLEIERERFERTHPGSRRLFERSSHGLLAGVPMNWMTRWPGAFPVFMAEARGASIVDVDGNRYVDLCLGDTGAMCGHSPEATILAVRAQLGRGMTTMLPTEDAAEVGDLLCRRFGLRHWQFTTSATDANRFVIRYCRQVTKRPKILVFNHCYHGTVDETVVTLDEEGRVVPRHGSVGPPVDPALTTRVVEFNDVEGLERELSHGDVACVLAEPAMTNVGIVEPEPGFHEILRGLCDETGTLLVIDETHTLSCGPGGFTRERGLRPDAMTMGKAIGGGIPVGAFGLSDDLAARVRRETIPEVTDVGGVGGTLAGNALQIAAVRATLGRVLTDGAYHRMIELARRYEMGIRETISHHGLGWTAVRLGCRVEYMFTDEPPRNGAEADRVIGGPVDELMHLAMLNRGILFTPFHMMALISPATTEAHVGAHTVAFAEVVGELMSG